VSTFRASTAFARELYQEIQADEIATGAAALAFYWMLALFPAAIFSLSLLPFLPIPDLSQALFDLLDQLLPGASASLFRDTVQHIVTARNSGLLSFGLLFTVWSASSGLYAVMQQLNRVYGVKEARSFWKGRGVAIALTLLFLALLIMTFGLVIFGGVMQEWIANRLGWSSALRAFFATLRWLLIALAVCCAFAAVYRLAPNQSRPLRVFSPGTLCATAGLLLASFGFRTYVSSFSSFDATYGGLGAAIILLVWLFLLGWVILLGAEIDDLLEKRARTAPARAPSRASAERPRSPEPSAACQTGSERKVSFVVWAGLAANLVIAISKFVAAGISGSSALLSEAIHSTADTGNALLLALGSKLSRKPPDRAHPFGRGQEIYFWGLIVALVLFGVGGGMSLYEGIRHVLDPRPIENVVWSYAVLAVALVAESSSFIVACRNMRRVAAREGKSFFAAVHGSKNPEDFIVLFEDAAALLGLAVAFAGVYGSHAWNMPVLDGIASIGIGAILTTAALLLAYECRSLLLGEAADPEQVERLRATVARDPAVERVGAALTMFLGPEEILLNLAVDFKDGLSSAQVEDAVQRLERAIRGLQPAITRVFIEAKSLTQGLDRRTAELRERTRRADESSVPS
jgi:cation diffusion facilitator family transporter